jgi:hypothetical protein
MISRKHLFKLNCSQLHERKKTQRISTALLWVKTSSIAAWKDCQ